MSWAMIDGRLMPLEEAAVPVTDVGFTHGYSVFETMLAGGGRDVTENLHRLRRSAEVASIRVPADPALMREIDEVRAKVGPVAVVRLTITGDGRRVVVGTAPEPGRWGRPVRCITGAHQDDALMEGRVKHRSRMGWMAAVRQASVDELLLVDADGRFTEGASCAILAVIGATVHTAQWDRRILASTTLRRILGHCDDLGIEVVRQGAPARGPLDGLYVASTTRGLAPVIELDGEPRTGWEPVGQRLREADAAASPERSPSSRRRV